MTKVLLCVAAAAVLWTAYPAWTEEPPLPPPPSCMENAVDAVYGFDMFGQPRLYEGQTLYRTLDMGEGRYANLRLVYPATDEHDDATFSVLRDFLCAPGTTTLYAPDGVRADYWWYRGGE